MRKDGLHRDVLLGNPFLSCSTHHGPKRWHQGYAEWKTNLLQVFRRERDMTQKTIASMQHEIPTLRIAEQLRSDKIKTRVEAIRSKFEETVCSLNPTAFWERYSWEVKLPYRKDFDARKIPTRSKANQMPEKMRRMIRAGAPSHALVSMLIIETSRSEECPG